MTAHTVRKRVRCLALAIGGLILVSGIAAGEIVLDPIGILFGISETPFSLLIAFIVLGETLTLMQGIGSCLIVASIAVITIAPILSKPKKPKEEGRENPTESEPK